MISKCGKFFLKPVITATLCAAWALLIPADVAFAASPLGLNDETPSYLLGHHMDILEDPSGSLTIWDVSGAGYAGRFRPALSERPVFGFTRSALWVRFTVDNSTSGDSDFLLELDCPPLDYATLYSPLQKGAYDQLTLGDHVPFEKRKIRNRKPLFPITQVPGSIRTYYMRFTSQGSMHLNLTVWKTPAYFSEDHNEQMLFGVYFGILLVMMMYNLFIFISVRDRAYLAYSLYIFMFACWALWNLGYIYEYIFTNHQFLADISGPFFLFAFILTATRFIALFLNTSITMPKMHKLLNFLSVLSIAGMPACFILEYYLLIQIATSLVHVATAVMIGTGLYSFARGYKPARLFLMAWSAYMTGGVIFLLKDAGVLPMVFVTKYSVFIGSAMEVTLLAFALGDRINIIKKEKEEAQNETIRIQKETTLLLEHEVGEQTKALNEANRRLQELDSMKNNLFANISHEIRTPLTLILTPVEYALHNDANDSPDRALLETIYHNASRLLGLINDLLDLVRLDAGRLTLNVESTDIVSLVTLRAGMIESACRARGLNLEIITPDSPLMLWVDRKMMAQIVDNLLSNAIKFTRTGGDITIGIRELETECLITVEDTGVGIPSGMLESIFERFSSTDMHPEGGYYGTGIGLAIVKEFTALHGGSVTVSSISADTGEEYHGTSITVSILVGRDHFKERSDVNYIDGNWNPPDVHGIPDLIITPQDYGNNHQEPDNTHPAILIVEDNQEMHILLGSILGRDYRIYRAMNGKEALALLKSLEAPPDLVLTDIMMPEMDGFVLAETLRADPRYEGIPVMFLSALAELPMKIEGFRGGAADFISKPFSSRELKARISAQLRMKSKRDNLELSNRELYCRLEKISTARNRVSDSAQEKVASVIQFVNEHFTSELSRDRLADAVGLSPDQLSRVFNRITGQKITKYVSTLRVQEAARMLRETDMPIITISFEAGFENLRTFNRAFSQHFGMSPSEFRKLHC
jgi:two-component system, sensor histidine kinase LadS